MMNWDLTGLLNNFKSMQEEFISSNNRTIRGVEKLFDSNLDYFLSSLYSFNDEYVVIDIRELKDVFEKLKNELNEVKTAHTSKYLKKFNNEKELLNNRMCSFFKDKINKGSNCKRKISSDIKQSLDKMCDFDIMGLEEDVDNVVYNFKVAFENKYINNEYCKDDFNKIVRSFKHSMIEESRDLFVCSTGELQNIVSRCIDKSYNIVDHYKVMKR